MAATNDVEQLRDERCPDCGSRFARDLKRRGYRRHLEALPKRNRTTGEEIVDDTGHKTYCGGSSNSWGKGNRDRAGKDHGEKEREQTDQQSSFTVQSPAEHNRTLLIGNILKRRRKLAPDEPPYEWAVVRDVISAPPAADSTIYVAVLCEGIGEHAGQWFIWRLYFTNDRYGRLAFGQFSPQTPMSIDKWLRDQITERRWYDRLDG